MLSGRFCQLSLFVTKIIVVIAFILQAFMILVLDPAVSLEIWMAKARFLARPLQTLKVPGYTLKIMFQKYMKPRENETQ